MAKDVIPIKKIIPKVLQAILNTALIILALVLSFLMMRELLNFIVLLFETHETDYTVFLAKILVFFLYFEFITMIIKYFKEDYHFPLRYFIYIGITAMIRLIIVEHDNPQHTLIFAFVILVLIVGYFIINMTPRERPTQMGFRQKQREKQHME